MSVTTPSGNPASTALLPPPKPAYILRGHAAPINALAFFAHNARLVSGDAEGWLVVWDTAQMRAVAVWRGHGERNGSGSGDGAGVAAVRVVDEDEEHEDGAERGEGLRQGDSDGDGEEGGTRRRRILSHGRDHKLRVWRFDRADELDGTLSTTLPVDQSSNRVASASTVTLAMRGDRQPYVLHTLDVNALNFCAFALCALAGPPTELADEYGQAGAREGVQSSRGRQCTQQQDQRHHYYIAAPNALHLGAIDIFHLPSQKRIGSVPAVGRDRGNGDGRLGMVMAVDLAIVESGRVCVVAGYEDGSAAVWVQGIEGEEGEEEGEEKGEGESAAGGGRGRLGGGAAGPAMMAREFAHWRWTCMYLSRAHSQPVLSLALSPDLGLQSGMARPLSPSPQQQQKQQQQLLLRYFITTAADAVIAKHPMLVPDPVAPIASIDPGPHIPYSSLPFVAPPSPSEPAPVPTAPVPTTPAAAETAPLKTLNTRHAGQQGLSIRNDGRICATAGWDGRARVYGCDGLKEHAVLKWHSTGCFVTAFAEVGVRAETGTRAAQRWRGRDGKEGSRQSDGQEQQVLELEGHRQRAATSLAAVRRRRAARAQGRHWLAVGGKDGKVSLWEIF